MRQGEVRNRKVIEEAKDAPCFDCGHRFPPVCMDFHHIEEDGKSFRLGSSSNRSLAAVLAEISKCVLLCANCHRLRHANRSEVMAKAKARGVRFGRPTVKFDFETMRKVYSEENSIARTAKRLGVCRKTIQNMFDREEADRKRGAVRSEFMQAKMFDLEAKA